MHDNMSRGDREVNGESSEDHKERQCGIHTQRESFYTIRETQYFDFTITQTDREI